jgi:hypothetical protein
MLPVRRQLEGPDLERLLDQVKTEYGDAARIVQAEKVRTGGVGGFFARERFHIDVEINVEPDGPAEPAAPAAPRSLLDLVERVSDEERELAAEPAREAAGRLSTESPSFEAVLAALRREEAEDPDEHGEPAVPEPGATVALRRDGLLGIPADVLPPHAVDLVPDRPEAAYGALVTWLRSVPAVPPPAYAPGQIVAVAGEVAAALRAPSRHRR